MFKRVNTMTEEFLKSAAGKEFARSMVRQYLDNEEKRRPDDADKEALFNTLIDEFLEHLGQHAPHDPEPFRNHLVEMYWHRFVEMYPEDDPDAELHYVRTLTAIVPWLAHLTLNCFYLHKDQMTKKGVSVPPAEVTLYHLQWARESFGWWRANVAKLEYNLNLPRPCKCRPDALLEALDPTLRARLEQHAKHHKPVEVEEGCPVC